MEVESSSKNKKLNKRKRSEATPNKENDKTPTSKKKKNLLNIIQIIQESNEETVNPSETPVNKKKHLFTDNIVFQESAEEAGKPSETPVKMKKRMEIEEPQGECETEEPRKEERQSETPTESEGLQKKCRINDLYRMPKRSRVSAQIYSACQFIMEQQVEVSHLNRVYMGHCVPKERSYRKELRRKYMAKFGGYSVEQDELILRRFKTLASEVVTEGTPREFLQTVLDTCSGKSLAELHKSKFRTIAVRNIIGLYVGQVGEDYIWNFWTFFRLLQMG